MRLKFYLVQTCRLRQGENSKEISERYISDQFLSKKSFALVCKTIHHEGYITFPDERCIPHLLGCLEVVLFFDAVQR